MIETTGVLDRIAQVSGAGSTLSKALHTFVDSVTPTDQKHVNVARYIDLTVEALIGVIKVFADANSATTIAKTADQDTEDPIKQCGTVFDEIVKAFEERNERHAQGTSSSEESSPPFEDEHIKNFHRRLQNSRKSLVALPHALQSTTIKERRQLDRKVLENEFEKIRQLDQQQKECTETLEALERALNRIDQANGKTIYDDSATQGTPDFGEITECSSENIPIGFKEPVQSITSNDFDVFTALADNTACSNSDELTEKEREEHLTMDQLYRCAMHAQDLLKQIILLKETFQASNPPGSCPKDYVQGLYRDFGRIFKSEMHFTSCQKIDNSLFHEDLPFSQDSSGDTSILTMNDQKDVSSSLLAPHLPVEELGLETFSAWQWSNINNQEASVKHDSRLLPDGDSSDVTIQYPLLESSHDHEDQALELPINCSLDSPMNFEIHNNCSTAGNVFSSHQPQIGSINQGIGEIDVEPMALGLPFQMDDFASSRDQPCVYTQILNGTLSIEVPNDESVFLHTSLQSGIADSSATTASGLCESGPSLEVPYIPGSPLTIDPQMMYFDPNLSAILEMGNGVRPETPLTTINDTMPPPRTNTPKTSEEPPRNAEGKIICKFAECIGKTFERPSKWRRHKDRHDRPYKCHEKRCASLQGFSYSGGLKRHQREVHDLHRGTRKPILCPVPGCKRSKDAGFTRTQNRADHIKRMHQNFSSAGRLEHVVASPESPRDGQRALLPRQESLMHRPQTSLSNVGGLVHIQQGNGQGILCAVAEDEQNMASVLLEHMRTPEGLGPGMPF